MDSDTKEMFQSILTGIQNMETRLGGRLDKVEGRLDKVENEIKRTQIMIETDVTKKIESLFDGYMLTHKKQWEMEKKIQEIEKRLEYLEAQSAS